jgi:hypothetical protein
MERHIIALADAYSNHWLHRLPTNVFVRDFMTVESKAHPGELTVAGCVKFRADLYLGWHDERIRVPGMEAFGREVPNCLSGFTAVLREIDGTELGGEARSILLRAYPMDNIPIRRGTGTADGNSSYWQAQ